MTQTEKKAEHVADDGHWCDGRLLPYDPLTHYIPVTLGRLRVPLPRVRCEKCGTVRFAPTPPEDLS